MAPDPHAPLAPGARRSALAVALAAALRAGCAAAPGTGGDGGSASDGGAGPGAGGGIVLVRANPQAVILFAEVFSNASATLPGPGAPGGGCTVTPLSPPTPDQVTVTSLDVGASLVLTYGTSLVEAPKGTSPLDATVAGVLPGDAALEVVNQGAPVTYRGARAQLPPPAGTPWTLATTGAQGGAPAGTLATGAFPGPVVQDPTFMTSGSVTPGSPATVTWTGGADAEVFHILGQGNGAAADCYAGPGATRFVVPADVTRALGAQAMILVSAQRSQVVEVEGEPVRVVSEWDPQG